MSYPVFEYELMILERHLDSFGHVNNATYLEILEEARWDLCTRNGYGMKEIQRAGLGPVILEVKLRFSREIHLRRKIRVRTQLKSYPGKVGILNQVILSESGEQHAEAEFKFGLFDLKSRKLIVPTREWQIALGITPETTHLP